jgi:hypothetical protein
MESQNPLLPLPEDIDNLGQQTNQPVLPILQVQG